MPLEVVVEKLDGVPEALREEYEPHGEGKFILKAVKAAGFESPDQVKGLKSALQKERENVGAAKSEAQKIREMLGDMTPEQIAELRQKQAEAAEAEARKAGEWDKLKGQMVTQHEKALADKDARITALQAALNAQLVDAEALRVLADEKGNSTLLMPHIQRFTRVVEVNGKHTVQVIDEQGNPRVDAKGEPLTITALVKEMRTKEVFAGAFAGSGASGGGANPNNNGSGGSGSGGGDGGGGGSGGGGGAAPGNLARSKMSVAEKAAYIAKNGSEAFLKLPW